MRTAGVASEDVSYAYACTVPSIKFNDLRNKRTKGALTGTLRRFPVSSTSP